MHSNAATAAATRRLMDSFSLAYFKLLPGITLGLLHQLFGGRHRGRDDRLHLVAAERLDIEVVPVHLRDEFSVFHGFRERLAQGGGAIPRDAGFGNDRAPDVGTAAEQ